MKKNRTLNHRTHRLTLEALEQRQLLSAVPMADPAVEAPSLVVTTANDVVDAYDGVVSLREAISYAGTDDLGSDITFDTTVFATTQTIALGSTLDIGKNLTIDGAGKVILDGGNSVKIMNIAEDKTVALNGLTLQHGYNITEGGAVYNYGALTVTNSTFSGNTANNGGAVCNLGTLTVTNSTFSGNTAGYGGAVYSNGTFTVTSSTFSGNTADSNGGAVDNSDGGTFTAVNSTFSGNTADIRGGAVDNDGTLTAVNCTFSGNAATNGGAVYNTGTNAYLVNSILVGNTATVAGADIWTIDYDIIKTYAYYCLVGGVCSEDFLTKTAKTDLSAFEASTGTTIGVNANDIFDPATLQADGTFHIKADGTAARTGTLTAIHNSDGTYYFKDGNTWKLVSDTTTTAAESALTIITSDQLGTSRLGTVADYGIYANGAWFVETVAETPSVVVNTIEDISNPYDGKISLREAITYAGTGELGSNITFDATAFATLQTITLGSTLNIDKDITIDGAGKVVLDGGNTFTSGVSNNDGVQIMNIAEGKIVALNGLTLQHGYSQEGGAVYNYGKLTATNCTFSGNTATDGGAVFLCNVNIVSFSAANCTFSGNSAEERGAAIGSPSYTYTRLVNCLVLDEVHVGSSNIDLYYCVYNTVLGIEDWRTSIHSVSGKTAADVLESTALNADGTFHIKADGAAANSGTKLQNDGSDNLQYWDKNAETPAWVNADVTTPFTTAQLQVDQLGVSRLGNAAGYDIYATGACFAETVTETPSTIVTTTDDVVNPYDGLISFREAVELYSEAGDTITFTGENGTQNLNSAVTINKNLTIGDYFTLSTNDESNDLFVAENGTENITFRNVTIQNGNVNMGEGGITIVASKILTLGNSAFGSTELTSGTFANNGKVIVYKSWDCNAANFGSVEYWSTTDQTVLSGTYGDLSFLGSGEKTASGNVTARNLSIATGNTLVLNQDLSVTTSMTNSGNIILSGDFNYTGADTSFGSFTYKANDGKIAAGMYSNLTITGDCTRTLAGAVMVSSVLTLNGSKGVDTSDSIVTLDGDNKTLTVAAGKFLATYAAINNVNCTTAQTISGWDVNTNTLTGSGNTNLTINLGGDFSATVGNSLTYGETLKDNAEIEITYSLRGQNATLSGSTGDDTIYNAERNVKNVNVSAAGYKFSGDTLYLTPLTFTVNPKEVTVDWSGDTDTYTYNGADQGDDVSATYTDINNDEIDLTVLFSGLGTTFKNAGDYTATAIMTTADGNYTLLEDTRDLTINQKEVTISGITAQNKVYDGTTAATLDFSNASIAGTCRSETLTLIGATSAFADKNIGKDKTVNVTDVLLGDGANGGFASNYTFAGFTDSIVASISEAPSVVVTTASDVVDEFDGLISLREAIAYAGTGTLGSVITFSDTIDWAETPIELALGELKIDKALTIQGSADKPVTIDAKGASRIFYVSDGQELSCEVKLTGLNLLGGKSSTDGGAIYNNNETLALREITFTNNQAENGGAIYNSEYGTLTILDSDFGLNSATTAGGAIYNHGYLSLAGTLLSGNSSTTGGAVYSVGAPLNVTQSSFAANNAQNGGAIALDIAAANGVVAVSIDDSYFIGNTASGFGGAIYSDSQATGTTLDVAVVNSVIYFNSATKSCGGIYNTGANVKTTVINSTVALNSGTQISNNAGNLYLINDVVVGMAGAEETEIYNVGNLSLFGVVTGQIISSGYAEWNVTSGVEAEDVFVSTDPAQTDLALKTSGPAATNGTLAGNILIIEPDMGNGSFYYLRDGNWTLAGDETVTLPFDPTNADGNYGLGSNDGGVGSKTAFVSALNRNEWGTPVSRVLTTDFFNAGAYAIDQEPEEYSTVVTTLDDTTNPYDNQISLREAIRYAETLGTPVTFAVADGSTLVVNSELNLAQNTVIDGGTKNLTLSGNFQNGVLVNHGTSTLRNLKIFGGKLSSEIGQGISNYGNLTLENVQVSLCGDAATTVNGGAIGNNLGATLTMVGGTVSGNTAQNGAGIYNLGEVHIQDTVFTSNLAQTDGGAFYGKGGSQTFDGVSVYGNQAYENGGGIYIGDAGDFEMKNSLVFGNGAFTGMGSGGNGGGLFLTGGGTITQSTIAGNFANENGGGIYTDSTEKLIVRNSLVSENKAGGGSAHDIYNKQTATDMYFSLLSRQSEAGNSTILDENCISQLYAQFGKIPDANPSNTGMDFADADWNLQLDPAAPTDTDRTAAMIDAGDNAQVADGAVDFYGNTRIANGIVDMGAIEAPKVTLTADSADPATLTITVNSSVLNPSTLVLKQRVQGETDWSDSVFSFENNVLTVTGLTSKTPYEFQLTETKTAPVSRTVYPDMKAVSNVLSMTTAPPVVTQEGSNLVFRLSADVPAGETVMFQYRLAGSRRWTSSTAAFQDGQYESAVRTSRFVKGKVYEYRFVNSDGETLCESTLTVRALQTPSLKLVGNNTTTVSAIVSRTDANAEDYLVSYRVYTNRQWSEWTVGTAKDLLADGKIVKNPDGSFTASGLPVGCKVQVKLAAVSNFNPETNTFYLESGTVNRTVTLPQPRKLAAPSFQVKATGPKTAVVTFTRTDSAADEIHCRYREYVNSAWSEWKDVTVPEGAKTVELTGLATSARIQVQAWVSSNDTDSYVDSSVRLISCTLKAVPTLQTPIYRFDAVKDQVSRFACDVRTEKFEVQIQVRALGVDKTVEMTEAELADMTCARWLEVLGTSPDEGRLVSVTLRIRALPAVDELLKPSKQSLTSFSLKG